MVLEGIILQHTVQRESHIWWSQSLVWVSQRLCLRVFQWWIRVSRCWIRVSLCWIRVFLCWIRVSQCLSLSSQCWIRVSLCTGSGFCSVIFKFQISYLSSTVIYQGLQVVLLYSVLYICIWVSQSHNDYLSSKGIYLSSTVTYLSFITIFLSSPVIYLSSFMISLSSPKLCLPSLWSWFTTPLPSPHCLSHGPQFDFTVPILGAQPPPHPLPLLHMVFTFVPMVSPGPTKPIWKIAMWGFFYSPKVRE